MTIYFTNETMTADSEHELRSFVERQLLSSPTRVKKTLDGAVCETQSASEVIQAFVMGASRIDCAKNAAEA